MTDEKTKQKAIEAAADIYGIPLHLPYYSCAPRDFLFKNTSCPSIAWPDRN